MLESVKTALMCSGGAVAIMGFIFFATKEIIKFAKWLKARKEKRLISKNEKLRVEKEKEVAYKLYLEQKAQIEKVSKEVK